MFLSHKVPFSIAGFSWTRLRVSDSQNDVWASQAIILMVPAMTLKIEKEITFLLIYKQIKKNKKTNSMFKVCTALNLDLHLSFY